MKHPGFRLGWCAALLALATAARANPSLEVESLRRVRQEPNPRGLQLGFWANHDRSDAVLRDFGPRPVERVDFTRWAAVERSPGEYTRPEWNALRRAHLNGSTIITSVNTIFTREVQPASGSAIPAFYPQRITHPQTRQAAKAFLHTYVGWLLDEFGALWLSLDYEFFWNYPPTTPEIRQEYRDWYLEAAAVVRAEAARRGLGEQVKLVPIANGEIIRNAQKFLGSPAPGHQPAAWLREVVAASDALAVDTYAHDPKDPASAATAFDNIRFWLTHYADPAKPFFVTENGFSTIREEEPNYPTAYHARGTEAQQAAFFADMFRRIAQHNATAEKRISTYCIWMYADAVPRAKKEKLETYFGLRRLDGSAKPAFAAVRSYYRQVDADPAVAPTRVAATIDVREAWRRGEALPLVYESGNRHDVLEARCRVPLEARGLRIEAELQTPGALVAELNGESWMGSAPDGAQRTVAVVLENGVQAGQLNTLRLRFTGVRYPVAQSVLALKISAVR